jgi:hypothetical protein
LNQVGCLKILEYLRKQRPLIGCRSVRWKFLNVDICLLTDFRFVQGREVRILHVCMWETSIRQNHVNHLKTKRRLLYLKTQSVPRCKHFPLRLYNQFMVWVAQITVCSQINTKHVNTVWAERTIVECWTWCCIT